MGITALNGPRSGPSSSGRCAMRAWRAVRSAGVEAHGTGTSLGDPIEVEARRHGRSRRYGTFRRLGRIRQDEHRHLRGAAGVAGPTKAVLVLQHREIPRNLHFTGLNPHIATAGTRIVFPAQQQSWSDAPRGRLRRSVPLAGPGTNTHIVSEEAPACRRDRGGSGQRSAGIDSATVGALARGAAGADAPPPRAHHDGRAR